MKYLYFVFGLVLVFSSPAGAQETGEWYHKGDYYFLLRSDPDVPLVESFDEQSLPEYIFPEKNVVLRSKIILSPTVSIEYDITGDRSFHVKVGVWPTVREAEEAVLDYMNILYSVYFKRTTLPDPIGNNMWMADDEYESSIVFIRNNLFVLLSYSNYWRGVPEGYPSLETIARRIDNDIQNGAPYLVIKDSITVPEIVSITSTHDALAYEESCIISVDTFDPLGRKLTLVGGAGDKSGGVKTSPNTFRHVQYETEDITIPYWAVTDGNLYSHKKTITIGF